jgi:hypothetical protein
MSAVATLSLLCQLLFVSGADASPGSRTGQQASGLSAVKCDSARLHLHTAPSTAQQPCAV